jgi:threonine synthase
MTRAAVGRATMEKMMRDDENLTTERATFVTHLECSATGERHDADELHNLSRAGKPLMVRYDLAGVHKALSKEALAARPRDLWRYRELLPVRRTKDIVSLGEPVTPLVSMPRLAARLRAGEILVKDEGRLPTGSFKARGLVMAVSMAKALGVAHMAMPTNGNAGAALAAYASRAGIRTTIFCPDDTPEVNVSEIGLQGGRVYRVNGLIDDCGKIVAEGKAKIGWFDTSTLKEPYRIEGKKTMGIELAEQLGWRVPDVILYPTGGGTGLIGMWKAFAELEAIGFISGKRPRMVAVQAAGCAPMVRAYEAGEEHAPRWENAHTIAAGIRVPQAIGDFLILRAVRESGGFAIAVPDDAIEAALAEVAREEGFLMCPEGAATYAALKLALADGRIRPHEEAVLFNCATGLKYPLPPVHRMLDRTKPIDFTEFS